MTADAVSSHGQADPRQLEFTPLAALKPAARNPKRHDGAGIQASIARFGFAELPLIDERTGLLVAGHGRVDQLADMKAAGQEPPDGVRVDRESGDWLVPVVRGWRSRSDAEAEAYLVASNQLTTNGGWDDEGLADLLSDLATFDPALLELTGFSAGDLEELLAGTATFEPPPTLNDPDDVPEPPATPRSQRGDVWLLGKHRVLCGDSTDTAAIETMLAGDRADCMWTDPPYGVDYEGKTKDALKIENDQSPDTLPELLAGIFAAATVALKPGAPFYIAHPDSYRSIFEQAVHDAGWRFRQNLIWVKNTLVLGHSDYHYRHEPILYGFTDGGSGRLGRGGDRWYGDDAQTTVFEVAKPARNADHPTMKPVELITAMLGNSCPRGGLVYDACGGSGSTLIAAHHLGMHAALVELDPRYVDVICRRYQEHTGELPILAATGEEVDFTAEG